MTGVSDSLKEQIDRLTVQPKSMAALSGVLPARLGLAELGVGKSMAAAIAAAGMNDAAKSVLGRNAELMKRLDPLADWKGSSALAALGKGYAEQVSVLSRIVPAGAMSGFGSLGIEVPASFAAGRLADIADSVGFARGSSLSQVIQASGTLQEQIAQWQGPKFAEINAGMASSVLLASRTHELAERLAPVLARSEWKLAQPSAASFRALEAYTRGLPTMPDSRQVAVAKWGAQTSTGLLSAAVVRSPIDLDRSTDEALDELLLHEAFHGGGQLDELVPILTEVDPQAGEHLRAAFEKLDNRHGAAQSAAHMLVETIDWLFRAAAPDVELMGWIDQQEPNFRKKLVFARDGSDRPTLTARVRFVVRHRPGSQRTLAKSQADLVIAALPQLRKVAEGVKHGGAEQADVNLVRSLATTLVGLLGVVFTRS